MDKISSLVKRGEGRPRFECSSCYGRTVKPAPNYVYHVTQFKNMWSASHDPNRGAATYIMAFNTAVAAQTFRI
ncbi:unnamed protein product, partial [Iphiclides podalirius]